MMRKRKPTDLVQLKIRMTEAMRAALEEEANRRGTSINAEVVHRLDRAFDRSSLLGEVIELVYGRQTAGLLLALGAAMAHAVEKAGEDPKKDDWALDAKSYLAAKYAARVLLELWNPTLRGAADQSSIPVGRAAMEDGFASVEAFVGLLEERMKNPKRHSAIAVMLEFLGPIAAGMIEEMPNQEKAHKAMRSVWEDTEATEGKGDRTQKKGTWT